MDEEKDKELKALREEALRVIIELPMNKQIELWNTLHRFKGGEQDNG